MKKTQIKFKRAIFSSLILAGLVFIAFNLSSYSSWSVGIAILSIILALAASIFRLVESFGRSLDKPSILNLESLADVTAIDRHYQKGKLFQLQGKTNRAIKEFKKILSINPEDSDVYYQLGKIYQEKGKKKESNRLLRRCLELDKDKKWTDEVEKVLPDL